MLSILKEKETFSLRLNGRIVFSHSPDSPAFFIGHGANSIKEKNGNLEFGEYITERIPLDTICIKDVEGRVFDTNGLIDVQLPGTKLVFSDCASKYSIVCLVQEFDERLVISFKSDLSLLGDFSSFRLWIRLPAQKDEYIYGCGEQFSFLNLRGEHFPLWCAKQGIGRNKKTYITWQADAHDMGGGDYYSTFYPQTTFISDKNYFVHVDCYSYADFDFRNSDFHELLFWSLPSVITISVKSNMKETLCDMSSLLGRMPELPDWAHNGIMVCCRGGIESCDEKLLHLISCGVKVSSLWISDWVGSLRSSTAESLVWNWTKDNELYSGLKEKISTWNKKGIHVVGYINPYLMEGESLYAEAAANGYLVKDNLGEDYLLNFGFFEVGLVDFSRPAAFEWYKRVIKEQLLDLGFSGWMADFGEDLPDNSKLFSTTNASHLHNKWPGLWAKCNREAIEESGALGEVFFFSRTGNAMIPRYATMMWSGDQNVDWSKDDGLESSIIASLSSSLCGCGLMHSDIGGYTTLFGIRRSKNLLLRWAEYCVFTPLMRESLGSNPKVNFQIDSDDQILKAIGRLSKLYVALKPYRKAVLKEYSETGMPVMRALFLEYEKDIHCKNMTDEYLLGSELLIAPILKGNATSRFVYLPSDNWVHLWSGKEFLLKIPDDNSSGVEIECSSNIGYPPVFFKKDSPWEKVFLKLLLCK